MMATMEKRVPFERVAQDEELVPALQTRYTRTTVFCQEVQGVWHELGASRHPSPQ